MRGRGWAVSLAVAAWAVVLVGGAAAPAGAVQVVDPPVPPVADPRFDWDAARAQMAERAPASRVPGSVLRSGWTAGGTGTEMRIAAVRRSVASSTAGRVVIPSATTAAVGSKFGMLLRGAGTAVTAALGVDLVYTGFTGGFSDNFGFGGLYGFESAGLVCDITALFGGTPCSVAVAPGYDANGDLGLSVPGWMGGNNVVEKSTDGVLQFATTFDVVENGHTAVITATLFYALNPALSYSPMGKFYCGQPGVTAPLSGTMVYGNWWPTTLGWNGSRTSVWTETCAGASYPWRLVETEYAVIDPVTGMPNPGGVHWLGSANSGRPVDVGTDPERWWSTTWLCEGGSPQTANSAPWHESDGEWPAPVQPTCDGSALLSVTVTENGTGTDPAVLYEWPLGGVPDPAVPAWAAAYPQCTDGSCVLELLRIDPTTGTRVACFDNPELCLGWFEDPAKVDNFICTYGGQDVGLGECNMYAPTFDPTRWPASGAAPYGDPETGATAAGAPVTLPEAADGCPPPFSWSAVWNNWWLFKAVDCGVRSAAKALFVPVTLPGKVDALTATFQTRTPYPQLVSVAAALAPPEGGTVCMVLSLPLGFVLGHDQPFLDSCTWADPVSQFLRDYRVLFAAAVWISVISPLAWWAWRQYAPGASGVA